MTNVTQKECGEKREKIATDARTEKNDMFNNLKASMETKIDKLERKIDDNEEKQNEHFEKVYTKIDAFAKTKLDKDMFMWVIGILITILIIFGGILLSEALNINTIKTALQIADITYE